MGNPIRLEGDLDIIPPLPWTELKKNPGYRPDGRDNQMRIEYDEETVDTPDGELTRRTGTGIGYPASVTHGLSYSQIHGDLEKIIKALPKGTAVSGWFDCTDEQGESWRIAVVEGNEIIDVHPEITWPEWMS